MFWFRCLSTFGLFGVLHCACFLFYSVVVLCRFCYPVGGSYDLSTIDLSVSFLLSQSCRYAYLRFSHPRLSFSLSFFLLSISLTSDPSNIRLTIFFRFFFLCSPSPFSFFISYTSPTNSTPLPPHYPLPFYSHPSLTTPPSYRLTSFCFP